MRSTQSSLRQQSVMATPVQQNPIPSIRLISATPSATGMSSEASTSANFTFDSSWGSIPVPLAPRPEDSIGPRKRLVPKKSKLGLLGKDKSKDFSDVVRRVGGGSLSTKGFDIYVDPMEDPEIGEIVMVKKKKSRAALDGMRWGALGEVTNVPSVTPKEAPALLKVKGEEKDKWWSIGRGRKDSKEKTKEGKENKENKTKVRAKSPGPQQDAFPRSKTPEPLKLSQDSRARFNSLDSGILLATPTAMAPVMEVPEPSSPVTFSRAGTPTAGGLLAPPGAALNQNSIALRAMRSVRSLARIGSWAQLRNPEEKENVVAVAKKEKEKAPKEKAPKEKEGKENVKEKKKDVEGEKKKKKKTKKDKAQTVRLSTSSFEVGALTASPEVKTLGKKKHSILGLGLPSSMRLQTMRGGSTASSAMPPIADRLSIDSAVIMGRDRVASTMSTGSSLRPLSTTSSNSRISTGSSAASVRWDEEGLVTVKEQRKKEREGKVEKKDGKESKRSLEGRRRTRISEVFPVGQSQRPESPESVRHEYPIVTVESATADGHGPPDDDEDQEMPLATPMKKARARPLSEQLLGKTRPRGMHESDDGVISILDAATNDLALLINHLDLEATPGTPDRSPLRPSSISSDISPSSGGSPVRRKTSPQSESPLKKSIRAGISSISSLRPYAQSRGNVKPSADLIGQQIAPWPTLIQELSPLKQSPPKPTNATSPAPPTFRLTHKRTMTPAPEPDPSPVFQPLRPAKSRVMATLQVSNSPSSIPETPIDGTIRAPSSLTFGSRTSRSNSYDDMNGSPTPSPVFKRAQGHARKRSSLVPVEYKGSRDRDSVPIPPEARRVLGMTGTMGGSDVSCYAVPDLDVSDPDSDIPDELQIILAGNSDRESTHSMDDTDTFSYHMAPPSPGLAPRSPALFDGPPTLELPVFHAQLIDEDDNHADVDEGGLTSEEDTKKSFDFTGELKKLNESGGSDRRSFVEQLENAFRTPAKVDLRYDFGGSLHVEAPPVPKLPLGLNLNAGESSQSSSEFDSYSASQIGDMKEPTLFTETKSSFEVFPTSRLVDVKEPTLLPGSDSLGSSNDTLDVLMDIDSPPSLRASSSSGSRPSDGQLNTSFKFGGLPKPPMPASQPKEITLSDIIPPPSHARSLSNSSMVEDEDSVLKSIFAQASDVPQPRVRLDSDSSSKRRARDHSRNVPSIHGRGHSRQSSALSFSGFDSFDEVRRGFEFGDARPAFYPPPGANRRSAHARHESLFSIASVSSYGRVIDSGSVDPFDYGLPSLRERPSSEDMSISMSMSVDDTFSFLDRLPQRRRVESDASSFYFKPSAPAQFNRGHRRHESNMSVSSLAPPISLYNRSFGTHRRNDSNTSASSMAQSYAMHGANGGRAAWARHRQDASMDSVMSDFSAMRLGRPGIGDKMFDTTDQGMPLSSISASPPEHSMAQRFGDRSSYDFDSILDDDRRTSMDDSLFDKTGNRSSMSSDSVFGYDYSQPPQGRQLHPRQYRPISSMSIHSVHGPVKEDDTMISMLGGGRVRRISVASVIDMSPCVRVEKRKHSNLQGVSKDLNDIYRESPNKARIVEKPSIASTSSYQFGEERMIRAQRGLLERQSLEDSCLIADGEDLTASLRTMPVFSRPGPATRSRSSTYTSSSGGDTPPLSSSDGSSISEGSQSSIDLSHVNIILSNATHPMSITARARARARARGHGHRRRFSQAHASRSSVYETIEEEMSNQSSPARTLGSKKSSSPTTRQPVFIVESETASILSNPETSIWDDERGIVALRKYYALRDEAQDTVTESKRQWTDTPFSVFALQSFQPPKHPAGMKALLEHSVQNYGPLPSELGPRRVRSRTQSRASPYPQRLVKISPAVEAHPRPSDADLNRQFNTPPVLQQIPLNSNILSAVPSLDALKPFSPLVMDLDATRENAFGLAPAARPRVGSTARRTALGWSKRSNGGKASTDQKENVSQGMIMTPGESLRISRPRPRGRPTPASQHRPIRV